MISKIFYLVRDKLDGLIIIFATYLFSLREILNGHLIFNFVEPLFTAGWRGMHPLPLCTFKAAADSQRYFPIIWVSFLMSSSSYETMNLSRLQVWP
jgi:hypothetical protein